MLFLLQLIIVLICFLIAFQDLKDRLVFWWLYAFLFIIQLTFTCFTVPFGRQVDHAMFNLGFIFLQYLGVCIYFSLKSKKLVFSLVHEIGLGDVLYLLIIALSLQTESFLIIYGVGLLLGLFWVLIMNLINKEQTIPLAGLFCLVQMILVVGNLV